MTSRNSSDRRITELDGLRGLAILFVLVYHYANFDVPPHSLFYYLSLPQRLTWTGVDLFFVLSGFLIGGILIDQRESSQYFSTFYLRRFHRILPIYYILIASLFIGTMLWPRSALFASAMPLWPYPLFLQNLLSPVVMTFGPAWSGATWSLAIEEQFYLLLPLAVRRLSAKSLLRFVIACVLAAPIVRTVLILNGARFEQVHPLLPARADGLGLGVLVAMILRSPEAVSYIRRHAQALCSLGAAMVAILICFLKWTNWKLIGTFGYTAIGTLYAVVLLFVLLFPVPRLKRFLNWQWLRWLGTVSYCVYLIHTPVHYLVFNSWYSHPPLIHDGETLVLTLAALVITFEIAQLSWDMIERPLLQRAHTRYRYHAATEAVGPLVPICK